MSLSARKLVLALAAALAVAALAAAPGLAGGGGGGGGTAPPPVSQSSCPQDQWVYQLDDGSTVFANEASGAGCVWVRNDPAGFLRLDHVILAPGWTYVIQKNGEGTQSRVELTFTETATGRKVDFRVEFGKTKIG